MRKCTLCFAVDFSENLLRADLEGFPGSSWLVCRADPGQQALFVPATAQPAAGLLAKVPCRQTSKFGIRKGTEGPRPPRFIIGTEHVGRISLFVGYLTTFLSMLFILYSTACISYPPKFTLGMEPNTPVSNFIIKTNCHT